jgi:hypothetical protein
LKETLDREPSEGIYSACIGNPVTAYAWILLGRCVCNGVWCGGDVWGCWLLWWVYVFLVVVCMWCLYEMGKGIYI